MYLENYTFLITVNFIYFCFNFIYQLSNFHYKF